MGESSSSRDLQREVKVLSQHVKELEESLKNHNTPTLIEHPSAIEMPPLWAIMVALVPYVNVFSMSGVDTLVCHVGTCIIFHA